jgi:hypothetical protein
LRGRLLGEHVAATLCRAVTVFEDGVAHRVCAN